MKSKKIYNVFFPIWFLILMPTMWLLAVPLNFIIDSIVLLIAVKALKIEEPKNMYKKSIIKVFIFGFIADIIGAAILAVPMFSNLGGAVLQGVNWDPYTNIYSVLIVITAAILSAIIIYLLNRQYSFNIPHVTETNKKKLATIFAIFTLPYFFLVPTRVLYNQNLTSPIEIREQNSLKSVYTYDRYVDEHKGIYLGNNSEMIEAFQASKKVVGDEPFADKVLKVTYEIKEDTNTFVINYVTNPLTEADIDKYNLWSEKIAVLLMRSSLNTKAVEFNISTVDSLRVGTEYKSIYFEYKYEKTLDEILTSDSYIKDILAGRI